MSTPANNPPPSQPTTPVKRPAMPKPPASGMQIVFGSILAISLLLAINFSGRIAAGRKIESERDSLVRVISTLQVQATALQGQLGYVNSDAYIDDWARTQGKMIKPDEILVVPVPGQATPAPVQTAVVSIPSSDLHTEPPNWKLWWQLFFDSPPPDNGQQ